MKLFATAMVVLALTCAVVGAEFEQRWVFLSCNLRTTEGLDEAMANLEKAAASDCNYALVTDSSHLNHAEMPDEYWTGIARFKKRAAELGVTLIPTVYPTGYGGRYLNFDDNLAAGLPVKDAPFMVSGLTANPDPSAVPAVANGGFEEAEDNVFAGWSGQDNAATVTLADSENFAEGKASLKITNFGTLVTPQEESAEGRPGRFRGGPSVRLAQSIKVQPFKRYVLSFQVKTEGLSERGQPSVGISAEEGARRLFYRDFTFKPTQDWTAYSVDFNTLNNEEMELSIGVSRTTEGSVWFDDIRIAPAGLLNVLRREGTPVRVTSADGKTDYEEGKDFAPIVDPQLEPYEDDHPAPAVEILEGSRIADGDTILVSWYHPTLIYTDQVNISISSPAVFKMMGYDVDCALRVWGPKGFFMNVDEIRVAGWEKQDTDRKLTPGQLLAEYTTKAVAIIRQRAPEADIYVWSDMYTPFHNARAFDPRRGHYYLVNGDWTGSWETLPPEVIIMTWSARGKEAMEWFADRGHKQIMAGYYDARNTTGMQRNIQRWMTVSKDVPGVVGMMYTTWQNNYENMEEFFRLVGEYPAWVQPESDAGALPER